MTCNTIIKNNNISSNDWVGIYIYESSWNNITQNNISSHTDYGVWLDWYCENNWIYHNNFFDNYEQAFDDTGANFWDSGYPSGGNYWSDYSGIDLFSGPSQDISDPDGIGDMPYTFDFNQDNYPLMTPWSPQPMAAFNISLVVGWNLISIPLEISDTSISTVMDSITGQWDVVKYYDNLDKNDPWKTCRAGATTNDLANVDNTMGIWVHTTSACNLIVSGYLPTFTNIILNAGWNLVGYPTLNEGMSVGLALWGTGANRVEVFDPMEPSLIIEVGPTYVMKPGEGYWIHVPADVVWTINW